MDTDTFFKAVLADAGHYCLFAANASASKRTQKFYTDIAYLEDDAKELDTQGYDAYCIGYLQRKRGKKSR